MPQQGRFIFKLMEDSHLPYDSEYQLILSPTHITEPIVMNEHLRLLHASPKLLTASLRQQYWMTSHSPHASLLLPINLIKGTSTAIERSTTFGASESGTPVFEYWKSLCGPTQHRSKITTKCHVTFFICTANKAIH